MKTIKKVSEVYTGGTPIVSTITSSSTNSEIAGAKAVYDFAQDNYSTTEQVVGTWTDGKPLYRKVINIGALPSSATQVNYPHGISNLERIYLFDGIAYGKADGSHNGFVLPYTINSSTLVGVYWDGTNITVATTLDRSGYIGLFIVYYTKTTDTATRSLNLTKSANIENAEEKETIEQETKESLEEIIEEKKDAEGSGDNK